MTLRLLGAAGAIAVAMALEPVSFSRTVPQETLLGDSGGLTSTAPSTTRPAQQLPPTSSSLPPPGSTTLSMVPRNPKLVARLKAMLPPDMTIERAASGFRNQGQFVAAVQISHNLDIPFVQLRQKVVDDGLSLGQAIQALKPDVDISRELAKARDIAQ